MCNKLENFKSLNRCMKLIDKSTDSSVDVDVTYLREFETLFQLCCVLIMIYVILNHFKLIAI